MSPRAVLDFLLVPSNGFFLLGAFGLLALCLRRRRLAVWLVGASIGGFGVFGFTSAGELLMAPLDTRFPALDLARADAPFGIVVIGGHLDEERAHSRGTVVELRDGAETIVTAAVLAQCFPEARIVLSGHGGTLAPPLRDIDGMHRFLLERGVDEARIVLDDGASGTIDHVARVVDLMGEDRDQTWWLVVQAHRMARVVGVFRAQGFDPVPVPVDHRWSPPFHALYFYPFTEGLRMTDAAVHEWLGLALYRMRGDIPVLFPGPSPAAQSVGYSTAMRKTPRSSVTSRGCAPPS